MSGGGKRSVFEVTLKTVSADTGNIEILKGLLLNNGVAEEAIIECEQWPYTRLSVYFRSHIKALSLRKRLRAFHLKDVSLALKSLEKKDWQTKWKKEFKPFALTKTFQVIPSRYKCKCRLRGKTPLYIDTDLAFGTGLHATTRFMARFIERCEGRFENFLDLGTGTGILAMIAAKCGAKDIKAIDVSKDAVKVARKNCIDNDCATVDVTIEDAQMYRTKAQYDFVAANILTQELIRMEDKIINFVQPGKYLAVSGISLNNYDIFREVYDRHPLRCLKIEKGEGWVAILYKKI
ncbi:MAG: 50S ribosomal protein L11 methyltransferase [Candidatus Omnitrophica bacterium]|nr:50S ribosomal protein L11 methyltransferase [Candidatus Omnitrophota bacterium]